MFCILFNRISWRLSSNQDPFSAAYGLNGIVFALVPGAAFFKGHIMVVVGKHFTFLLIVVQCLNSNHLTAKKSLIFCSPNPTSTKSPGLILDPEKLRSWTLVQPQPSLWVFLAFRV